MLVDKQIRKLLNSRSRRKTAIYGGMSTSVTSVGYDLRTAAIYQDGERVMGCALQLQRGESVLIASGEVVHFGARDVGHVYLRNSLIRAGLTIDAPLYQPGHKTRIYYRLTNLSGAPICLQEGGKYAMLTIERLGKKPCRGYAGKYQNEVKFTSTK